MKKITKRNVILITILLATILVTACKENPNDSSRNKKVVSDYMDGFNLGDRRLGPEVRRLLFAYQGKHLV